MAIRRINGIETEQMLRSGLANLQRRYDDTAAMQRKQTDYTRRLLARSWWQRLLNVEDV